jgi:hypothetical protein
VKNSLRDPDDLTKEMAEPAATDNHAAEGGAGAGAGEGAGEEVKKDVSPGSRSPRVHVHRVSAIVSQRERRTIQRDIDSEIPLALIVLREQGDHLNIKVKSQDGSSAFVCSVALSLVPASGNEVFFKVKKTTEVRLFCGSCVRLG